MESMIKIDELKLHDSNLRKLSIDIVDGIIRFDIIRSIEDGILKLNFLRVQNIVIGKIGKWEDIEIYSVDWEKLEHGYSVHFIFLLGFGMPSWEMRFDFEDVLIEED